MKVYLSLGSNLGGRLDYLAQAMVRLQDEQSRLVATSSVYETEPQGVKDQPTYLNAVVVIETTRSPEALLARIHQVEQSLGRVRRERWEARTIDIDILLYGDLSIKRQGLVIPHPEMLKRAFVLMPLLEMNPALALPSKIGEVIPVLLIENLNNLVDQKVKLFISSSAFLKRINKVE